MGRFWRFIDTIKLGVWLTLIFLFHMLLYLALGTDTWLTTTVWVTGIYGAVIWLLKQIAKRIG
jgi:hypothetical protein